MAELGRHSRIIDVLGLGEVGRELLYRHGYDVGEGFMDVLSQYQSLEEAHRAGRLRELPELLERLNAARPRQSRSRTRRTAASKK